MLHYFYMTQYSVIGIWLILEILLIFFSCLAIYAENPVYAILFLAGSAIILCIFFLLLGAEFLSLMFGIVYIGAIIILFLFIVMLLNLDEFFFFSFKPIDLVVFCALIIVSAEFFHHIFAELLHLTVPRHDFLYVTNLHQDVSDNLVLPTNNETLSPLGSLLYEKYISYVLLSGLLLLVILMGVVLLLRSYEERVAFFFNRTKTSLGKTKDTFFLQPSQRIRLISTKVE